MKKIVFIACLTSVLSACGGGGSGTATQPQAASGNQPTSDSAPSSAPAAPRPVLIEAYGDSTMAGYSYPTPNQPAVIVDDNQPAVLQATLQARYGNTVTVKNEGVSGTRAPQLIDGSDGAHLPWIQTVANSKAQIVIVNYGINDSVSWTTESVDAYKNALRAIADVAVSGGKAIVFEQPNPICLPNSGNAEYKTLATYAQAMADVATEKGVPIADNYAYVLSLPNWQDMLSDCKHPKGALYELEAKRLAIVVAPLASKAATAM